ncbi:hypothetical protein [Spirosoma sp. KNUC1025]|uniref:hypothetical protein n=1 Tax=Spirosoma sp. KNUC1025 TaxID=2894082 RepID=UPI00386F3D8F|nr:glycosyltransferase [Spirosoma sp. KNUC1025]
MKIIFLCGSLEPGRDGVGDYVTRLAGELIKQGNQVVALALNDKYIEEERICINDVETKQLKLIRLPATWEANQRFAKAQEIIHGFQPEWISLQFVPFSFHNKGIVIGLDKYLLQLGNTYRWHIMFHELWVGVNQSNTIRQFILGQTQKVFIKRLIKRLHPTCITTSIPLYKKTISGTNVSLLPLFGNIPILQNQVSADKLGNDKFPITVVHFGSFTSHIEEFTAQIKWIQTVANSRDQQVNFLAIGEGGPFKATALLIVESILGANSINDLGRRSFTEVSEFFSKADLGISRADYEMYGKSGSTLAMLEHGLPVLLRGQGPSDVEDYLENNLFDYRTQVFFCDDDINEIPVKRSSNKNSLTTIASLFTQTLERVQ